MKRFLIQTLGCKVNQCESAALAHGLEATGYRPASGEADADVVIINTCTVTGRAAMQSRQAVRQTIRKHPRARIVVTGCYAQTAVDELRAIPGVDLIVGHAQKSTIPNLLARIASQPHASVIHDDIRSARVFAPLPWAAPEGRTRAFLKIQDGCNGMCTYCIVPYARGRSRSMAVNEVLDHFERLGRHGYREVVLTGIHLGAYGADFSPPAALADLIDRLLPTPAVQRVRLSSIEPTEVDARILDRMAGAELLCRHWHVPLQSGADEILNRMGRPYSRSDYAHVIRTIHATLPYAAIGADVLVGFPGEDDAAFRQTVALIETLPLTYLHVFPFSPRKGTPAAGFKQRPPEGVVKTRCEYLRRLGQEKKARFYHALIGRTVQVLIESATDPRTGLARGLSGNYVPITLQAADLLPNMIVSARIEKVDQDGKVFARLIGTNATER
jgi:threonylcarbamoyladenosine tRNA methylthiotransferase MtaB